MELRDRDPHDRRSDRSAVREASVPLPPVFGAAASIRRTLQRGSGASSASWKIKATSKSTTGSTICHGTSPTIRWIDRLQLAQGPAQSYRSEAEHFAAWLRIARRRADIDDTIIDQYGAHDCRCPVWRKRGKLVASGAKRRRRALGTSSSSARPGVIPSRTGGG
jgi:hypothetical protein